MYYFEFIVSNGNSVIEALGNARAFVKVAFPNQPKIQLVSSQVVVVMQPGKLQGTMMTSYTAILSLQSTEEFVTDHEAIKNIPLPGSPGMRPIRD
jgi:hypothetical protein